jgi:hypothetical protein
MPAVSAPVVLLAASVAVTGSACIGSVAGLYDLGCFASAVGCFASACQVVHAQVLLCSLGIPALATGCCRKNGTRLKTAFCSVRPQQMYPTVGLHR